MNVADLVFELAHPRAVAAVGGRAPSRCTGKNETTADQACNRDDAVAGCKQPEITEWFHNDGEKG